MSCELDLNYEMLIDEYCDHLSCELNSCKCIRDILCKLKRKIDKDGSSYLEDVYENKHNACVAIQCVFSFVFQGETVTFTTDGSGFFINSKGNLVTSSTVTTVVLFINGLFTPLNPVKIYVIIPRTKKVTLFQIVGQDRVSSLSVLEPIETMKVKDYLNWGNSNKMDIGDEVVSISNTNDIDVNSVTTGIIKNTNYESIQFTIFVQSILITNASYQFEEGSPILDKCGKVIAVKTSIGSISGGASQYIAEPVIKSILNTKTDYDRVSLGILYFLVTPITIIAQNYTDTEIKGLSVSSVSSSSSSFGLILPGDVLLELEGKELGILSYQYNLTSILTFKKPGDKVTFKIRRSNNIIKVEVVLDPLSPTAGYASFGNPNFNPGSEFSLPTYPTIRL